MNMINIDKYINSLVTDEVIPGISLLVAKGNDILINKVYGYKTLKPEKMLLEPETVYDLASLTKPLITSLIILQT